MPVDATKRLIRVITRVVSGEGGDSYEKKQTHPYTRISFCCSAGLLQVVLNLIKKWNRNNYDYNFQHL